jgi:uncharacterized membrane protein
VIVALFAAAFRGERLFAPNRAGIALAAAGTMLVAHRG